MTKQELRELVSECVKEQMSAATPVVETAELSEVQEAEAALEVATMLESAAFAQLYSVMSEGEVVEEAKFTPEELAERKKETEIFKAKWEALEACKSKNERKALQNSLGMGDPLVIKNKSANNIAKKLGKGFKAVGDKVVSVYSGKEGKGKQAAAIAVAATALAGSVAAAAIAANKKKAKEEENKK